jgi:hypothetical protein
MPHCVVSVQLAPTAPDAKLPDIFPIVSTWPLLAPQRIAEVLSKVCNGNSIRFPLTCRRDRTSLSDGPVCRFPRLPNASSKKLSHFTTVLFHFTYDLCCIHSSLRVIPAMASALTDQVWSITVLQGAGVVLATIMQSHQRRDILG